MEQLIGITGYARHGKDTAARVLVDEFDYLRIGFADALKSMALALNPIIGHLESGYAEVGLEPYRLAEAVAVDGWDKAKADPEVRRFLQVLGTEGVRNHIGENAWVEALQRVADPVLFDSLEVYWREAGYEVNPWEKFRGVVVPDVRFPNEERYIKDEGGLLIMVRRPNFDNGVGTDHPSEQFINQMNPDIVLEATSVEQLQALVRGALRERFV